MDFRQNAPGDSRERGQASQRPVWGQLGLPKAAHTERHAARCHEGPVRLRTPRVEEPGLRDFRMKAQADPSVILG